MCKKELVCSYFLAEYMFWIFVRIASLKRFREEILSSTKGVHLIVSLWPNIPRDCKEPVETAVISRVSYYRTCL